MKEERKVGGRVGNACGPLGSSIGRYGHSWLRTFCIGAAIRAVLSANPMVLISYLAMPNEHLDFQNIVLVFCTDDLRAPLFAFWLAIPVVGLFCVLARWLIAPSTSD